jgi:hypothetical protein
VAAAVGVVLALVLGPHSPKAAVAGRSPSPTHSVRPTANPTPTVGNLQLAQFQVGDCLTGGNMQLNTNAPWPKIATAVPCSQGHTAEVFLADNNFWPKGGAYPGNTITNDAHAACNRAFQAYVGIAYSKSMYSWIDIVPAVSTWPNGDRGLHCVAYYATPKQPAGVTIYGSIKGTRK